MGRYPLIHDMSLTYGVLEGQHLKELIPFSKPALRSWGKSEPLGLPYRGRDVHKLYLTWLFRYKLNCIVLIFNSKTRLD